MPDENGVKAPAGREEPDCFAFCTGRDGHPIQGSNLKAPLLEGTGSAALAGVPKNPSHDYCFTVVFPLPSITTEEEEGQFRKAHLGHDKSCRGLLEEALSPCAEVREGARIHCGETLRSLRVCVIEAFLSVFRTLGKAGSCDAYTFTSMDHDELFLCVKMSETLAERLADVGEYKFQLDEGALDKLGIKITQSRDHLVPAYVKYSPQLKHMDILRQYDRPEKPGYTSIFRQVDKVRLLYDVITDYIDVHELERLGLVVHAFPSHSLPAVLPLQQSWGCFRHTFSLAQPIDEVRDYFGEQIAFYFLFLQTCIAGLAVLVIPAVFCTALRVAGLTDLSVLLFTVVNIVWFSVLLKVWRRRESYYSNKWGTDQSVAAGGIKEPVNPSFDGDPTPSPFDENRLLLQADPAKEMLGYTVSVAVTVVYMLVVLLAAGSIQALAARLDRQGNKMAFELAAVGLTVQIKILDQLWEVVGQRLTHMEQHVGLDAWNQSKALKTFFMKFVNAFNSFFYMAFAQSSLDPESCVAVGGCSLLLKKQLTIVFVTYIAFGAMDVLLPVITMKLAVYQEARALAKKARAEGGDAQPPVPLSFLEQQAKMSPYTGADATADYLQVMLPLAFIVLFGSVMPLTVPLACFALATQLRADAWKLLAAYRRTFPAKARGIGVWNHILVGLGYVAVFNNIGLLLTQVKDLDAFFPFLEGNKVLAFFVLQNALGVFKLAFDSLIPNVPPATVLEQHRQEVQRHRLFEAKQGGVEGGAAPSVKVECFGGCRGNDFEAVTPLRPGDHMYVEATEPLNGLW